MSDEAPEFRAARDYAEAIDARRRAFNAQEEAARAIERSEKAVANAAGRLLGLGHAEYLVDGRTLVRVSGIPPSVEISDVKVVPPPRSFQPTT